MLIGYLAFSCDNTNKGKDLNTYINYILLHALLCKYNLRNSLNSFGTGTYVVLKGKSHELHICEPKHNNKKICRIFQDCSGKNRMAATIGRASHGG